MPLPHTLSRAFKPCLSPPRVVLSRLALALLCACAPRLAACKTDSPATQAPPPPLPAKSDKGQKPVANLFRTLQPGTEYATFDLPSSPVGDHKLHVVRIDAAIARPILQASERGDGRSRTAADWSRDGRFAVVINAGMYAQDFKSHVGYMRAYGHALTPAFNKDYQSVVAWGPRKPGMPAVDMLDLDAAASEKQRVQQFDVAIQNLRLIKGTGENVWSVQPKRWSEAALAIDKNGKLLLLFSRSPYSMHEFNEAILKLPLDIVRAQHLEGGPEASLSIHAGGIDLDLSGSYETAFTEHDGNRKQWVLPNVIGIERAEPAKQTLPLELSDLCAPLPGELDGFSEAEAVARPEGPEASCADVAQALKSCSDLKLECDQERTHVLRSGKGFLLRDGESGSGAFTSVETYFNPSECRTLSIQEQGAYGDPFVTADFAAAPNAITESERNTLVRLKGWTRTDGEDPTHALSAARLKPAKRLRSGDVELWTSGRAAMRVLPGRPQLQARTLTSSSEGYLLTAVPPEFLRAVALDPWELTIACYSPNRHARMGLALYDRRAETHRWIAAFPDDSIGGQIKLLERRENLLFARLHTEQTPGYEDLDIVIDLETAAYFAMRPTAKLSGALAEFSEQGLRWSRAGQIAELSFGELLTIIAEQRHK